LFGNDNDDEEPITFVVDASGLTVSKKGDYIEEKWIRKKKEFTKLHIATDAKSKKVVSFRITRGNVHDIKKFCPLVRESSKKCNIDRIKKNFGTSVSTFRKFHTAFLYMVDT
jgi:Transposase DDE domain